MSETGLWTNDWLETQQKYWEAWTDMSRKALGLEAQNKNPWEQALDHWWQAVAPAVPASSSDFMNKMMDQGKAFFHIADDLVRNLDPKAAAGADWTQALNKTLNDMEQVLSGEPVEGDDSMHKMMAFWEMPFDNWQRLVSSMSIMPGDLLRNVPHEQVKESLHRFLSAPGLGYTREEQGAYQDLVKRAIDYQRTMQSYMQFFSGMGLKAVDRMRGAVVQRFQEDKPVESARALYDLWVGCCEDVYSQEVSSEEYAKVHGELVNSLMAFKHRLGVIVDESLGAMNMPTRAELRTLQDRLQETRRDNKTLRRELEMMKELVMGQSDVASTRTARAPSVTRKVVTKKAPGSRRKSIATSETGPETADTHKA